MSLLNLEKKTVSWTKVTGNENDWVFKACHKNILTVVLYWDKGPNALMRPLQQFWCNFDLLPNERVTSNTYSTEYIVL